MKAINYFEDNKKILSSEKNDNHLFFFKDEDGEVLYKFYNIKIDDQEKTIEGEVVFFVKDKEIDHYYKIIASIKLENFEFGKLTRITSQEFDDRYKKIKDLVCYVLDYKY